LSNLPEPIIRHHTLKTKVEDSIYHFCTVGLLLPRSHIEMWWKAPNMDAYYVLVRSGAQFMVSGPELSEWESRKCVPGREDFSD